MSTPTDHPLPPSILGPDDQGSPQWPEGPPDAAAEQGSVREIIGTGESHIGAILRRFRDGEPAAADALLEEVYTSLQAQAAREIRRRGPQSVIQATALVNEVWMRLQNHEQTWNDREHFLAVAATAMRNLLIDAARRRAARPAAANIESEDSGVGELLAIYEADGLDLLSVQEALTEFATIDPDAAKLVELRFYVGATADEAAHAIGMAPRTADRRFGYAKRWLKKRLEG